MGERGEDQLSYGEDEHCLGELKHYRSLMPMAMEARKPIFRLTAADGAIGSHGYSVRACYDDFEQLGVNILNRLQSVESSPFEAEKP